MQPANYTRTKDFTELTEEDSDAFGMQREELAVPLVVTILRFQETCTGDTSYCIRRNECVLQKQSDGHDKPIAH